MRRAVIVAVLAASSLALAAADGGTATGSMATVTKPDAGTVVLDIPKNITKDDDKLFYILGLSVGKGLSQFSPSKSELELIRRGLTDGINNPSKVSPAALQPYSQKVGELAKSRGEGKAKIFLDKAAKDKGVEKLDDGILYTSIKEGTGATPKATDKVKVNYRGTLPDGSEFDSSFKRGQPIEFPLNGVIPCWTKGVAHMKVGGKAKLVCPPKQAYGEHPPGGSGIPVNSPLTFEVELLSTAAAPPPAAPGTTPPAAGGASSMPTK